MTNQFYDPATLRFILDDMLQVSELCKLPRFTDHTREGFDMILDATKQLAESKLRPILVEMDRDEPQLVDGRIRVHPAMKDLMKEFGDGGWISASADYDHGGNQVPVTISNSCLFIFGAANYSAAAFPYLCTGAAHLLTSFARPELRDQFVPKMFAGEWQGTMALTEPEAGSSLSDLTTSATPQEDGTYLIRGQKIFISAGDHDAVENVVHLMLARIEGAPAGTKGISLFVVPRERMENGELVSNDVKTAGVFHKMGYKGAPIAHIMMGENDNCVGQLIGEPHQGLKYMFQMMNEARIAVGINAVSIASAAYYAALDYSRERNQGRPLMNRDPESEQIPIIQHADVKRMLLFQKSVVEGCLALTLKLSVWADRIHGGGEPNKELEMLLDLLTPVAKSYPSEAGIQAVSAGLQCLGGYGYTREYILEQFYREARIHPIHEGTTGIHGMDLLGRKIARDQGQTFGKMLEMLFAATASGKQIEEVRPFAEKLESYANALREVTTELGMRAMSEGPEAFLSDATLYLEVFSLVTVSWMWIEMGNVAAGKDSDFHRGKLAAMRYYLEYELPKCDGLLNRLKSKDRVTLETEPAWIN